MKYILTILFTKSSFSPKKGIYKVTAYTKVGDIAIAIFQQMPVQIDSPSSMLFNVIINKIIASMKHKNGCKLGEKKKTRTIY